MDRRPNFEYTRTKKFKITLATVSGLFMFSFLLFFQPFGVNNYRPDEKITGQLVLVLFIFAALVASVTLVFELFVYHWIFSKKHPKRYFVWVLIELVSIASATFMLYNFFGGFHDFYFYSYLRHIFEIGSILVISFLGVHFYFRHNRVVAEYENVLSLSIDNPNLDELVLLKGDYKNDQIALPLNNIVFITSEDNYVSLNYIEDSALQQYLIRSTLTKLEKKLDSKTMIRINRSQMINVTQLASYKIHSGQLKLKLNHTSQPFEVSKSRQSKVLALLKNSSTKLDSSLN